jgi:hypothetical protein
MFEPINSSPPLIVLLFIPKLSKSPPLFTPSRALYSIIIDAARAILLYSRCYVDLLLPPPPPPLYRPITQKPPSPPKTFF